MSTNKTVWIAIITAFSIVAAGTLGYHSFEDLSWPDAFYQTLLIVLTHFNHVENSSGESKILSIALIVASLGLIGYLLKWFAEYMIGVGDNVRKRRLQTKLNRLKDHYIVCGLGRVGSQVAREMSIENIPFVAIDRDQKKVDEAVANGYVAFAADSGEEEQLIKAGVDRATGLVASLGDDSANLLATLAARSLNPELYIVARANRQQNELKLKRAGANRVALPYQIGGYHMASMALRPNVVDYMDVIGNAGAANDLKVEEMVVSEKSSLAGHRLGKALAEGKVGATVIAINGSDGTSRVRPTGHEVIYPGDRLIILGAKPDLTKASELIR